MLTVGGDGLAFLANGSSSDSSSFSNSASSSSGSSSSSDDPRLADFDFDAGADRFAEAAARPLLADFGVTAFDLLFTDLLFLGDTFFFLSCKLYD